jgi:DNA modification methylase
LASTLHNAHNMDVLRATPDNSIDSVVTDPPYDLTSIQERFGKEGSAPAQFGTDGAFARLSKGFMGQTWDGTGIAFTVEFWAEVLRVLKPGGHLLAFGGTRTYHRMVVAIEDAGFEIRDSIDWLYGSGFPKSHDISKDMDKMAGVKGEVVGTSKGKGYTSMQETKLELGDRPYHAGLPSERADRDITAPATPEAEEWDGWGTALKPAHEPIVVARKPISEKSVARNVLRWGTGAINIDACRVGTGGGGWNGQGTTHDETQWRLNNPDGVQRDSGRWPANLILTHSPNCNGVCTEDCPVRALDEQSGQRTSGKPAGKRNAKTGFSTGITPGAYDLTGYGDTGGASRFYTTFEYDPDVDIPFFYCAKASRSERNKGCEDLPARLCEQSGGAQGAENRGEGEYKQDSLGMNRITYRQNSHPTVKPVALMRWLCRLVTPPGGTVLDPFMGSNTTGVGATLEGFDFVGCESDTEEGYFEIAKCRQADAEAEVARVAGSIQQLEMQLA